MANNYEKFQCANCVHKTESNGKKGCAYFGLNEDEVNGKYQDEGRTLGKKRISNEDLRRRFGVHIPREGSVISGDRLLKDYINNNRCTAWCE